jgi:hypothetical protein
MKAIEDRRGKHAGREHDAPASRCDLASEGARIRLRGDHAAVAGLHEWLRHSGPCFAFLTAAR